MGADAGAGTAETAGATGGAAVSAVSFATAGGVGATGGLVSTWRAEPKSGVGRCPFWKKTAFTTMPVMSAANTAPATVTPGRANARPTRELRQPAFAGGFGRRGAAGRERGPVTPASAGASRNFLDPHGLRFGRQGAARGTGDCHDLGLAVAERSAALLRKANRDARALARRASATIVPPCKPTSPLTTDRPSPVPSKRRS